MPIKKKSSPQQNLNKHTKRRKPVQRRAIATVEAILKSAKQLIAQEGFQGLTTNRIAEHANVSIGSLYQYFPTREAIAYQLYEDAIIKIADQMKGDILSFIHDDVDATIPKLVEELLELYESNQIILINLLEEVPELRAKTRNLSFEKLVQSSNRLYFAEHQDAATESSVDTTLFFVSTTIMENVQKYLFEKPHNISRKAFVDKLSKIVIFCLKNI